MSREPEYYVNGVQVTSGELFEALEEAVRRHEHDGDRTPAHYMGDGVTAGEALRSMLEATANADVPPMALFWWGTAFKYVWRMFAKGQGASDCAKARDCLARLADEMGWGDDGA